MILSLVQYQPEKGGSSNSKSGKHISHLSIRLGDLFLYWCISSPKEAAAAAAAAAKVGSTLG